MLSLLQDHAQYPRFRREVLDFPFVGHAANPFCADAVDIGIRIGEGKRIADAGFSGTGCALCVGASSLLCEYILGKSISELAPLQKEYLQGEEIGRMREGCVTVSAVALQRAIALYASL
jgi:nitrogen fixation NifU-like protein